jgi:DNA-binding NtrC family response regulator
VISRAAALYAGKTVDETMVLGLLDHAPGPGPSGSMSAEDMPLFHSKTNLIKEMEKQMILNRLIANKGNQRRTANDLGMPKSTLHDRLKSYNIDISKIEAGIVSSPDELVQSV